ncbi:MAG: nucleoside triphosphate pyrophosphohydrolase [Chitinophagaceae bacterium]|nr:nucleoside triphosphate pyrophosphohydrolase [Chitinophagaceae bacterium]
MTSYSRSFDRIRSIMDELRTSCPWDRKQTIQTLRPLTIEETYELADAITNEDWDGLREELGDLLLHIVFYSRIASEKDHFDLEDVIEQVCNKLVNRHPHIYDSTQVENDEDVKRNWEQIKLKEGKTSVLSGVPLSLPAMIKALRLQEKSKQVGFEWEVTEQVKEKLMEELAELQEVIEQKDQDRIEDEFGDVLFSMMNYARFLNVDPENALERTNKKFQRRFMQMESMLLAKGQSLNELTLGEMDVLWNQIKANEAK